jgi:hypothetical protein
VIDRILQRNKAAKRGYAIVTHKFIEVHNKPLATPQISKRSLLSGSATNENDNINEK